MLSNTKHTRTLLLSLTLLIMILGAGITYTRLRKAYTSETNKYPIATNTKAPILRQKKDGETNLPPPIIPEGKQTYRISGNFNSPEPYEAVIDPVKVHVGEVQAMTLSVRDDEYPIELVQAEVETDTGIKIYQLELIEGTRDDGKWEGSWTVHDTHDATYHTTFTATNTNQETSSITLTWTDPCSPPPGGTWTLQGNCNTGTNIVTGADNGDINLNGQTATLEAGATLARNAGRSIIIGMGSIVINATAQIVKSDIYIKDSDGDGYPSSLTQYITSGSGRRRRNLMISITTIDSCDNNSSTLSGISYYYNADGDSRKGGLDGSYCSNPGGRLTSSALDDCNDTNSSVWRNLTGYRDSDGDGVNNVSAFPNNSQSVCSGNSLPSGWTSSLSSRGDCAESNASKWQELLGYPDSDGDGVYSLSNDSICSGSSIAAADGSTSSGTDCNDGNRFIWKYVDGYWDKDGDGHNGEWESFVCTDGNLPNGWTDTGDDCNESNVNIYQVKVGYFSEDGDGYVSDSAKSLCTNKTAHSVQGIDCDDTDGSIFPRNKYDDIDSDGYYTTFIAGWVCAGPTAPTGMSYTAGTDCYDSNSSAHPGQTSYFASHRGDGSWDYNCVNGTEKQRDVSESYSPGPGCYTSKPSGSGGWAGSVASCGAAETLYRCKGCDALISCTLCNAFSEGSCPNSTGSHWAIEPISQTQRCR